MRAKRRRSSEQQRYRSLFEEARRGRETLRTNSIIIMCIKSLFKRSIFEILVLYNTIIRTDVQTYSTHYTNCKLSSSYVICMCACVPFVRCEMRRQQYRPTPTRVRSSRARTPHFLALTAPTHARSKRPPCSSAARTPRSLVALSPRCTSAPLYCRTTLSPP